MMYVMTTLGILVIELLGVAAIAGVFYLLDR